MAGRLHFHWLPFIKYSLIMIVYVFAGGLLLFYLEECRNEVVKISHTDNSYPGNATAFCVELASSILSSQNLTLLSMNNSSRGIVIDRCSKFLEERKIITEMVHQGCSWSWGSIRMWIKFVHNTLATIGYHEIKVTTELGRSFMVFYSLIGVPLSIVCYIHLGRIVRVTMRRVIRCTEAHFFNRTEPRNIRHKVLLYTAALILIVILFSAGIVRLNTKQWSFSGCLYFFTGIISTSGNDGSQIDTKFFQTHLGLSILLDVLQIIGLGLVSALIQAGVGFQKAKHKRQRLPLREALKHSGPMTANGTQRDTVINGTVAMDSLVILVRNDEMEGSGFT